MDRINPDLVPLISPGQLFDRLISDNSISIRILTKDDPAYFEVLNRPTLDLAVRQLMIAKSIDRANLCLSYGAMYPFLIQPTLVENDTPIPIGWIWDMHLIMPQRYHDLRLAYVIRVDGTNPASFCETGTGTEPVEYTGTVRLVFCANRDGSVLDYQMFTVDYDIASGNVYQRSRIDTDYGTIYGSLNSPETGDINIADYVHGQVTFMTLNVNNADNRFFYDTIAPVSGDIARYDVAGSDSSDYNPAGLSYGSGLLTDGAYNIQDDFVHYDALWNVTFSEPSLAIPNYNAINWHNNNVPQSADLDDDDELLVWSATEGRYVKMKRSDFIIGIGIQGIAVEQDGSPIVTTANTINMSGGVAVTVGGANRANILVGVDMQSGLDIGSLVDVPDNPQYLLRITGGGVSVTGSGGVATINISGFNEANMISGSFLREGLVIDNGGGGIIHNISIVDAAYRSAPLINVNMWIGLASVLGPPHSPMWFNTGSAVINNGSLTYQAGAGISPDGSNFPSGAGSNQILTFAGTPTGLIYLTYVEGTGQLAVHIENAPTINGYDSGHGGLSYIWIRGYWWAMKTT